MPRAALRRPLRPRRAGFSRGSQAPDDPPDGACRVQFTLRSPARPGAPRRPRRATGARSSGPCQCPVPVRSTPGLFRRQLLHGHPGLGIRRPAPCHPSEPSSPFSRSRTPGALFGRNPVSFTPRSVSETTPTKHEPAQVSPNRRGKQVRPPHWQPPERGHDGLSLNQVRCHRVSCCLEAPATKNMVIHTVTARVLSQPKIHAGIHGPSPRAVSCTCIQTVAGVRCGTAQLAANPERTPQRLFRWTYRGRQSPRSVQRTMQPAPQDTCHLCRNRGRRQCRRHVECHPSFISTTSACRASCKQNPSQQANDTDSPARPVAHVPQRPPTSTRESTSGRPSPPRNVPRQENDQNLNPHSPPARNPRRVRYTRPAGRHPNAMSR